MKPPGLVPSAGAFMCWRMCGAKTSAFSDYGESKGGDVAADGGDLLASKWHLYSFLYLIHLPATLLCCLFRNNRAFPPPFITSEPLRVTIPSGFHATHSYCTACSNSVLQVSEGIYTEWWGADRRVLYTTQKFPPPSTLCSVFSPLYSFHYFSLFFLFFSWMCHPSRQRERERERHDRYSLRARKMEHLRSEKRPSTQPGAAGNVSLLSHYAVFIHVLLAKCNFSKLHPEKWFLRDICSHIRCVQRRSGCSHVSICAVWLCNLSIHQQAV